MFRDVFEGIEMALSRASFGKLLSKNELGNRRTKIVKRYSLMMS